jgi:RNA polymerase sigma-70 factor (ECF subfamily)
LVRRAQKEDKEAFEELIRRHQHRVFAVAGGILKRREDVEDIAQQVFVKAYFSIKRFDQRAAFSTWLYKITVNECWDLLRKKKVRPLVYEADLSEEQARQVETSEERGSTAPDISDRLAAQQRVERLLEGLDERDRLMLILKEVEGFSIEEVAAVLDLNANTVKVRLFRARRRVVSQARKREG